MTVPLDNLKQNTPVGYKRSLKFDYDTGDFVRDGQHRLIQRQVLRHLNNGVKIVSQRTDMRIAHIRPILVLI